MRIRHAWPLLILVAVSSRGHADDQTTPPPAPPTAEAKAEAKKHIEAGTKFYNVQQYTAAADEYQQAYLLDPRPAYLYASAQSQRLGGDCAKALLSYRSYLRTNPPETERVKAEANIERCEQEIRDRESAVDPATIPPPYEVPPPPIPVEEPPPPPPPPPPAKSYVLGHLLVGLGAVAAGGGVYLFRDGRTTITDHNDAPSYDAWAASRGDLDAAKRNQAIGVAAMAGGAALITGGVVYYVMRSRGSDEQPPPVTTAVAADKAMVFFTRSF